MQNLGENLTRLFKFCRYKILYVTIMQREDDRMLPANWTLGKPISLIQGWLKVSLFGK